MPPPPEQPGARLNAPPNGVEAIVAPLPPEPSPEESAAQFTDIELTANRNTHTARRPTGSQQSRPPHQVAARTGPPYDETKAVRSQPLQKPPPTKQHGARLNAPPNGVETFVAPVLLQPPPIEQPGAQLNAPPSGVEAIVDPFPLLPPPKESAAQSQEIEFAPLRSARTLRKPTSLHLTPEPPSGEIANVPPPAPLETGSIRYAAAAESYGKLPPPLAEGEELN
ncbi:pollen-specific leucine-rich repeat extensin-like protein 1 [Drosophila rhopaloa]|uniref:Uncharacterized protein n=1 Tax=Drosophila rhopaloa TaxID=1041015 RepID=A0ABM5JCP8_DRORH|nr:pollen-specific leucine-rich repeat extensin-like protein 1 [Drosophila rhopaloa]